jgi:hypothetical protein
VRLANPLLVQWEHASVQLRAFPVAAISGTSGAGKSA